MQYERWDRLMVRDKMYLLKKAIKAAGLYKLAVFIYCRGEGIYLRGKSVVEYLSGISANAAFRWRHAGDGLPFPPSNLVHLVTNSYRYEWFYRSGLIGSQCIRDILEKNNLDISKFMSIFDFGCGCGRMMRQWNTMQGPNFYGSDYSSVLIKWCRENLPFARFDVNGLESMLMYGDDTFDFIYSISVFTHLTEDMGLFWIRELARVLKPGGILYVTVMGSTRARFLRKEHIDRFEAGEIVVLGAEHTGKNICAAFHPERYIRKTLAKGFHVLDHIPGGAKDASQDVYLLKKL